jgi:hypothetical protein
MEPIDDGVDPAPDATGASPTPTRNKRSWLMTAAVATGLAVGAAGLAGAATGGSSGSSTTTAPSGYGLAPTGQPPSGEAPNGQAPSGQPPSGAQDPATMTHGPNETLLTGDAATKAKAAALAAVPGATVIRVETDSSGAGTYEAHLKKSDGTEVTVLMDSSFTVTSTVDGFGGPGPQGSGGRGRPGASSSNGSSSSSSTPGSTTN